MNIKDMNREQLETIIKEIKVRFAELAQVGRWMSDELREQAIEQICEMEDENWCGSWSDENLYSQFTVGVLDLTDDVLLHYLDDLVDSHDGKVTVLNEMKAEQATHRLLSGEKI